jgi:hypothetical protein
MKTSLFKNRKLQFALALGCATLTGCFNDSGNNTPDDPNENQVTIQGRLQGDEESGTASSSGWSGTLVTMHEVMLDGSLSAAKDSAYAQDNGSFTFTSQLSGHHEFVLRSEKNGQLWMSRNEETFENGETEETRPLDMESTLEAAVMLELKKSEEGRQVKSYEVNMAINADVAASSRSQYRDSESSRNSLVSQLALSIRAASKARSTYLNESESGFSSSDTAIQNRELSAEATLNAAIYAANGNRSQEQEAEQAYFNAMLRAHLDAAIQRTSYARSNEAALKAMLQASTQISDSSRYAMARVYGDVFVAASDTATRSEFRRAGSSEARVQLMAEATARFRTAMRNSRSRAHIDTAMAHFRAEGRTVFTGSSTGSDSTSFSLLTAILTSLTISSQMDSVSGVLRTALNVQAASNGGQGGNGQGVGQAFAQAHATAYATFVTQQQGSGRSDEQSRAAANLMAFLTVSGTGSN